MESLNVFRHVLKAHPCGKDLIYQSGINNVDIALGVTSSPCRLEYSRSITLLHVKVFLSRAVTGSGLSLSYRPTIYYWLFIRSKNTDKNHKASEQDKNITGKITSY